MNSKVVVIVDGFSTGKYFAPYLKKRGYLAIHVQSSSTIPDFLLKAFCAEHYIKHISYSGDMNELIKVLKPYQICAVFAGTETSIYLADQLAEALHLPGNSAVTSELRRNKFAMIKAVNEGGLKTAKQFKSNNIDEILKWHHESMAKEWPLVIKPLHSAGTDGVRFCFSDNEIKEAVKNILGKNNKLGILNEAVLVQSFLDGQEYIVNTVSYKSKHHLTDVRLCHKKKVSGAGFISACEEMLPANEEVVQALKFYAFKALDLLKITHGPGHFEIMNTKEGPKIIEMGARLQGGINPEANAICLGMQQIDKTIDVYLEPERFISYYEKDYQLQKHLLWVFLVSNQKGKILSIPLIEKIKALSSFFSLHMNVHSGDYLERTIDYYSSPGNVHLIHNNKESLNKDLEILRQLEPNGFELSLIE